MAIYSQTLTNQEILALIPQHTKHILIVACGGCVNESLAYDKDIAVLKFDESGNALPNASFVDAQRISAFLDQNEFQTEIKLLVGDMPVLCINPYECANIMNAAIKPDIILTLSCQSGAIGLQVFTDIPVIPITNQIGYLAYTYEDSNNERRIVKARSKCSVHKTEQNSFRKQLKEDIYIDIRQAAPKDYHAIYGFLINEMAHNEVNYPTFISSIIACQNDLDNLMYVAVIKGKTVGFIHAIKHIGLIDNRIIDIALLAVSLTEQRNGIGTGIVKTC